MLLFNIKALETEAKGNPEAYIGLLRYVMYEKRTGCVPRKSPKDKYFRKSKTSLVNEATSFLINPTALLDYKQCDSTYKAQYIKLAARRSYVDYRVFGKTYLDLSLYPDINLNVINHNPLLKIEDNKVYFKFEDK